MKKFSSIFAFFQERPLTKKSLPRNPISQIKAWISDVEKQDFLLFPNAVTLATVSEKGIPSARVVLLKEIRQEGFVFFTNYQSEKAANISANGYVCLNIYWPNIERQIRILGVAEKVKRRNSEEYFRTRDRESQIGAWASQQSKPISPPLSLTKAIRYFKEKFEGQDVPCPPNWGGFLVKPYSIEFWQMRSGRVHDRFEYSLKNHSEWEIKQIFP